MKKISEPGIYRGVSMEAYHGDLCVGPSISSSGLRAIFSRSPAHYWCESYLNPDRIEQKTSEAFTLGKAAHHLLLGEDDFSTLFIARPDRFDSWRTDASKAWRKEQEAAGRTVLLPTQLETIRGMAKALAANPLVEAGILNGAIEESLVWQDSETGIWVKSRPDAVPNESADFADLKTSSTFGEALDREIAKFRYDVQGAVVGMACRELLGREMQSFSFVFVESDPPHCVEVVSLKSDDIAEAEKDARAALRVFAHCLDTGVWFGPGGTQSDARFAHIPDWTRSNAEYRRGVLEREIARRAGADNLADLLTA